MWLHIYSTVCWLLRIRLLIEPDSRLCSGQGSLDVCGQCICDEGFFGDSCECPSTYRLESKADAIARCTPEDNATTGVCSGRGECHCGFCRCTVQSELDVQYTGVYCQCGPCPYHNGLICGGVGMCNCGKCACDIGYTGEACECSTSVDTCRSSDGQICNGQGNCVCGQCECDPWSGYQGPTCDECPTIVEVNSLSCNSRGSLDACDNCVCDAGYYGRHCECDGNLQDIEGLCIWPNSTGAICSNRGQCICGMCYCSPRSSNSAQRYSGRYCQCDDYSCPYHDNMLCGGHGSCICGACMCREGFRGDACECDISHEMCIADNGRICNGYGECVCGRCECNSFSSFRGRLCEECPTCPGRCMRYRDCVLCKAFHSGPLSREECEQNCQHVDLVDVLDQNEIRNNDESNMCSFLDAVDNTRYFFSYTYISTKNNEIRVEAQTTKIGHGSCMNGSCICEKGFTGDACECDTYVDTCIADNGQICNGHGECVCGRCVCDSSSYFRGRLCEDCPIVEVNSLSCNSRGSLDACDNCVCDAGYYGKHCECDGNLQDIEGLCIWPNSTGAICSNRGQCICGMCYCSPRSSNSAQRYSGRYCQCDDYSCPYHDNMLCGGHGSCICGACMCREGFRGDACECDISHEMCIADNGRICNGYGECVCGRCECNSFSSFRGRLCEECPTCPGRCMRYRDCVLCKAFHSGPLSREECEQNCQHVDLVDVLDQNEIRNNDESNMCSFLDAVDNTRYFFSYTYISTKNNEIRVEAQTTKIGHGSCMNGSCICEKGFTGDACECDTYVDTCIADNGQICNGHGECVCGRCVCDSSSYFHGRLCEDCPIVEVNSLSCNSRGSLDACDNCVCDAGYYGKHCECDGNLQDIEGLCIWPNSTGPICSNRGQCICGMCYCSPRSSNSAQRYSGRYCQCDDYSCPYHDNMLCGGHGSCICGACMCREGFRGDACECDISAEMCIAENGQICNGYGECVCGRCVCNSFSSFRGRLCEECPTCPGRCMKYRDCVLCKAFHSGPLSREECEQNCPHVELVDVLDQNEIRNNDDSFLCSFLDAVDNTRYFFSYTYISTKNNEVRVDAQITKIA